MGNTSEREWLRPGATVYECSPHRWSSGGTLREATIAKVGKRDIVLTSGKRYSVTHLHESGDRWSSLSLIAPDDPAVARIRSGNRLARSKVAVDDAYQAWRSVESVKTAEALSDAAAAHAEAVREYWAADAQAVTKARA